MANKKEKFIALISSCQIFIFLLVFTFPFSDIYAQSKIPENMPVKNNNAASEFLGVSKPDFNILDLNTMLIPFELAAPAYRERAEELKDFIAKDYDVVLLQEVFSKQMQFDFIKRWYLSNDLGTPDISFGKKTGDYDSVLLSQRPNDIKVSNESAEFFVTGPKRDGLKTLFGSGLLLLSKYPVINSDVFCYEDRAGSDAFASKGVVYAKIKTGTKDDEYVHFFTTHLQSHGYIETRQKNLEELFDFISKILSEELSRVQSVNPVIITGDFNVPANSEDKAVSAEYILLTEKINLLCRSINDIYKDGPFYLKDLWAQKNRDNIGYTWIASSEEEINGSPYGETGNTIAIENQGAERIDYIFYFEGSKGLRTENLSIDLVPSKPEKMYSFKNGNLKSYTLSDHLGLQAGFKLVK